MMDLTPKTITFMADNTTFDLSAGDTLKIESDGAEYLSCEVPSRKTYRFIINIHVDEI